MIAGILALPFLLWSWIRHDNQEDADLATGIIGLAVIGAAAGALTWYALA
jgi:hypothetical protein